MSMKFIGAMAGVIFLVAEASAGGMPPETDIDANGVPVGVVEPAAAIIEPDSTISAPMETVMTAAADKIPAETSASPAATQHAPAAPGAPITGKDHH
jgi:hypothetical protein